jgi:hypothetical protein
MISRLSSGATVGLIRFAQRPNKNSPPRESCVNQLVIDDLEAVKKKFRSLTLRLDMYDRAECK